MNFAVAMLIAAHLWGMPACGQPSLLLDPGQQSLGHADPVACVISMPLDPGKPWNEPRKRCSIIVHEWGHLTGHTHSLDPNNVMYPAQNHSYWRCTTKRGIYGFTKQQWAQIPPSATPLPPF